MGKNDRAKVIPKITPSMIKAGAHILVDAYDFESLRAEIVAEEIFTAMCATKEIDDEVEMP